MMFHQKTGWLRAHSKSWEHEAWSPDCVFLFDECCFIHAICRTHTIIYRTFREGWWRVVFGLEFFKAHSVEPENFTGFETGSAVYDVYGVQRCWQRFCSVSSCCGKLVLVGFQQSQTISGSCSARRRSFSFQRGCLDDLKVIETRLPQWSDRRTVSPLLTVPRQVTKLRAFTTRTILGTLPISQSFLCSCKATIRKTCNEINEVEMEQKHATTMPPVFNLHLKWSCDKHDKLRGFAAFCC